MRIFISHSSKDAELVAKVCGEIEKSGHSCFLAPRDIRSGCEYAEEIINGIDGAEVVLLLLSQAANDSPHVLREIERAVSKKKSVIVFKLEEVTLSKSMEYFLMTHQWLSSRSNDDFSDIIAGINEYAAGKATAEHFETAAPAAAGNSSRRRNIIAASAAAVLLCAGAALGAGIAGRAPTGGADPAAAQGLAVPGEPAAEKQNPQLPQEEPAAEKQNPQLPQEEPAAEKQNPQRPQEEPALTEKTTLSVSEDAAAPQPEGGTTPAVTSESPQSVTSAQPPQTAQQSAPAEKPEQTESRSPNVQQNTTTAAPENNTAAVLDTEPAVPEENSAVETPRQPQGASVTEKTAAAEAGDWLMFGTYNGEPIKWRVLRLSEDGTRAVVISEDILTMKAYDAAESGLYNKYDGEDYWSTRLSEIPPEIQAQVRGDNRWEYSNIRTWLNSDRENVIYADQAPTPQAMSEKRSGYHTEAGFLKSFTKEERAALVETEISTGGSVTRDRVFLLSGEELEWLYEADVSIYAEPTAAAIEQDKSGWYKVDYDAYGVEDFFWWLRDANPDNSCECYYINLSCSDRRIASGSVGLEGYGIRPAMTLDLTSETVIKALENAHETE